jgi:hypothetical protein
MIAAMVLCILFSLGALTAGLLSLHAMGGAIDPVEIDADRAYAYFWFFFSAVTAVLAAIAYRWRDYKY